MLTVIVAIIVFAFLFGPLAIDIKQNQTDLQKHKDFLLQKKMEWNEFVDGELQRYPNDPTWPAVVNKYLKKFDISE